jgi:AbrB family looped-hinge helix DNA binding protein
MNTVTVSPKFQVVIPLAVREELGLLPGEKLRVLRYQDRVELIPVKPIKSIRGMLKGIDPNIAREGDRL